jgi:PAS domain S-box-containing protein
MFERSTKRFPWALLIGITSLGTVLVTVYSLSSGIYEVFPYLYLIPIIMVTYAYPQRGVQASLLLGGVYMGLVYFFGIFDVVLLTISTAWFYVFVSVGVVMSSLSEGLMREERRYHGIFDSSQAGIFTVDIPSMKIVEVNKQCAAILGYGSRELIGKHVALIWPDTTQSSRFLSNVDGKYMVVDAEVCLQNKQGNPRWALVSVSTTNDCRIVCSFVDITERRQIEEALVESEIKFRSIVERSLAGVFVVQEGVFKYVNPRYAEIHGYRMEDLIGKRSPRDLVLPEDWPTFEEHTEGHDPGVIDTAHFECRQRACEGEILHVEIHSSAIQFQGKRALVGTLLDITDRKRAADALRKSNEKLNLLGSITRHDLLNQLTAVQGYTGLAEESTDDEQVRRFLASAQDVTQKMQVLLQFTKDYQDMGVRTPEWQSVHDVFMQAAPSINSPEVSMKLDVKGLEIYADPLLEKVFYNLIDNSVRHGKRVTEITLRYQEQDDRLTLIYEDNGSGILPIEKELIFRRGYGRNTGYGLFLCRVILALTGMSIQETGKEGLGVRFEILVPPGHYRVKRIPNPVPVQLSCQGRSI